MDQTQGVKTRSQSVHEKGDNMAEVSQNNEHKNAAGNFHSSSDNNYDNEQYSGDSDNSLREECANECNNWQDNDSKQIAQHVKGKVAGIVDYMNNSPASSPIPSHKNKAKYQKKANMGKVSKTRTLSSKNGVLALENIEVEENTSMENQATATEMEPAKKEGSELLNLMRTLNATVKKLENKLDQMEKEKDQVNTKVSTLETVQSQELTRLRG